MVTVTLDELERNAVLASLDDRLQKLSQEFGYLKEQDDSPDNAFAIDTVRMAIDQTMRAQLRIAETLPDPEHPEDATVELVVYGSSSWSVLEQYQAEGR